MTTIFDFNPTGLGSVVNFLLNGTSIKQCSSTNGALTLSGNSHEPIFALDGLLPLVNTVQLAGPTYFLDRPVEYLSTEQNASVKSTFSCVTSSSSEWSIFFVTRLTQIPGVESVLLSINQEKIASYPGVGNVANNTPLVVLTATIGGVFGASIFSNDLTSYAALTYGPCDLDYHLLELSSDGSGSVKGWFDGVATTSIADVTPKSAAQLFIGAFPYDNPLCMVEQLNGAVARLIVATGLTTAQRNSQRASLMSAYGI